MQKRIGLGLLHSIGLACGIFLLVPNAPGGEAPRLLQWEATVEAAKKEDE